MTDSVHLIIHNTGAIVSAIVSICLAILSFARNPNKKSVNYVLGMLNVAVAIFIISHLIGTNVADHQLSREIFMFDMVTVYIAILNIHGVFALLNKDKEKRTLLWVLYTIGTLMVIAFIVFPASFLLDSVPMMYFPNYYNPGAYQWVMRLLCNIVIPAWAAYELVFGYFHNLNSTEQKRAKFVFFAMLIGWPVGFIPVLLSYGVNVDPAFGVWFVPLYSIPLFYGIVTHDIIDTEIIAKKALLYGSAIVAIGGVIAFFDLLNQMIQSSYSGFPFWIMPLFLAIIAVGTGIFFWKKMRESDLLKYEFMTIVTHKFRTPLTRIKWASENLVNNKSEEDRRTQIEYIQGANDKLVELTDLLVNVSESEGQDFDYKLERNNLSAMVEDAIRSSENQLKAKRIICQTDLTPDLYAYFDSGRIKFIIQTFIENAGHYSPFDSTIYIKSQRLGKEIICSVTDSGIGMSREELSMLFTRFYRSDSAKHADTEGMGIGLFISKEIMSHHKGRIWAESEGTDKGSTFYISFPAAK